MCWLAYQIPYVCYYIIKLSRQQVEVIQNLEHENVHNIRQGRAQHRKYKGL
jgi:hypothetical protein